ncbi:MAG: ATP-binding protein [Cyanobacteriota bacterium]
MLPEAHCQEFMLCHPDEVLNTAPCGFLSFTDDGTISLVNATMLKLLGHEFDAVWGRRVESILPLASRIFFQTHFFPLLKLHGKAEEIYISVRSKQGTDIPMLVNAVRRERAGSFVNDCIFVPMRQRIQYEAEILQAKKIAEAAIHAQNLATAALEQVQVALAAKQVELLELNAKLEEQVEQRTAQLQQALSFESLLQRITDKVRDSLDEGQILQTAVQELGVGLGIEYCDAGIYNADQTLVSIAYKYDQTQTSTQGQVGEIDPVRPVIYPSLLRGEASQFCAIAPDWVLHSSSQLASLACPIYDDQGILGDLWLFRQKEGSFSNLEIRLVQQVANHCAIAMRQSRLYQAAQLQVQELERLNQLKDDFLSTVSHELRTPMSSIKMATQMLEISLEPLGVFASDSNLINRYFKILQEEGQREISLINDLLDMTRLDSGTEPLNLTDDVILEFYIPHIAEPFIERTRNQQQELEIKIPENLPSLTTDLSYLERILTELLHNAWKYTPPGETITLSAQATPTGLEILVSNSGVEIPADECDRIFDKFYRIPNNDPWKHGGTGLGLALVKKFADQLGIRISVESSYGQTTFILKFESCG